MNLTQDEVEKLMATKSESEWNAMCDEIKRARGGQYPPDWWSRMMMTGLIESIQKSWAK